MSDKGDGLKASLSWFLKENHVLLSSMAVTASLTGFLGSLSSTLEKLWPTIFFYFFFVSLLTATMLIWLEVIFIFPKTMEFRLRLFKYTLIISYYSAVLFLLLKFRFFSDIIIFAILLITVGGPFLQWLITRTWVLDNIIKLKHYWCGRSFLILIIIVMIGMLVYLFSIVSSKIGSFLGYLNSFSI